MVKKKSLQNSILFKKNKNKKLKINCIYIFKKSKQYNKLYFLRILEILNVNRFNTYGILRLIQIKICN